MTHPVMKEVNPVLAVQIDRLGQITRKTMDPTREAQLENSLLRSLYRDLRAMTVEVPTEPLDLCEQAMVEQALTQLQCDGVRYSLCGGSASVKEGRFWAFESRYEKQIAERLKNSPQAAVTCLGILVSSCKAMIEVADCRILVVDDHVYGTNDCRGWMSHSIFRRLRENHAEQLTQREFKKRIVRIKAQRANDPTFVLAEEEERQMRRARKIARARAFQSDCLFQFRMAFERTQAKGSFKIMPDEVSEALDADIILPKSSIKPKYTGGAAKALWSVVAGRKGDRYRGPASIGIRDVSRNLSFQSSYTLIEHAPQSSLDLEIKPAALREIGKVRKAYEENDFTELFQLIGARDTQRTIEPEEYTDPEYTSSEYTVADACLIADGTGYMLKHPFVNGHLQKVLARWAYKLFTSGGFTLPGFALADDGYLAVHDGKVYSGSDWMPRNKVSMALNCRRGLVVRYPIRMKEDLLPLENMGMAEAVSLIEHDLERQGCEAARELACTLVDRQLRLTGTLTLHSETAARNGGDFDFDLVCVVEGDRFPQFVEDRFNYSEQHSKQKDKTPKPPSPWWNLPQVAMQARGNQIGSITDLKTSCLAKGREDLARLLVDQLQNALDQLKFGTQPDQELIKKIRQEVNKAPWLAFKQKKRIDEMPVHLPGVDGLDRVGQLYNFLRKELGKLVDDTVAPLSDFRGIMGGHGFNRQVYEECQTINRLYSEEVQKILGQRQKLQEELEHAQAQADNIKSDDPEIKKQLVFRRNQASAAYFEYEKRSGAELKTLIRQVRRWGQSKNGDRLAFMSALHSIVCKDRRNQPEQKRQGTGSIVFYAFPQEVVNQIAARSGGRPVAVEMPDLCDGEVEIDEEGRIFLVQRVAGDGQFFEALIFLAQVTRSGEVFRDRDRKGTPIVTHRVRPFPIQAGRSEIRDGKVVFPETKQQPQVPVRKDDDPGTSDE
ncbi:MAG TPA: hypothetical protein VKZ53_23755 [Candidatus Angelobacter sp.]|nr:hypothetical protein [Candidatus Angelobacter sp.]